MEADRWPDIERVFLAACERPAAEREVFVRDACAGDPALGDEVCSLLAADAEAEPYFERRSGLQTVVLGALADEAGEEDLAPGTRLGPWAVEAEVGRGGMGTVYRAHRADGLYDQSAAVKLVKRGMDSAEVLGRFRRERAVLAGLRHPHVARLLDGGTAPDGRPFLVMEFVEGVPITQGCDARGLGVDERLHLFLQACEAVAYAHRSLVVHRDLKPANILLADEDGRLEVKLLDFGIAKLLEEDDSPQTVLTGNTRRLTPEYAAPEQLDGTAVTTAADVYALGVVLYELLAGARPYAFNTRSWGEIERTIREVEPSRPSASVTPEAAARRGTTADRLGRRLRGDLDTIVRTALRKEPERRYASVDALAEDVRRYLNGLPIAARRDAVGYRMGKFVRRHRLGVAAGAAFGLLLAASAVALVLQQRATARERDRASAEAASSQAVAGFLTDLLGAADPRLGPGAEASVGDVLDAGARRIGVELDGEPDVQARMMTVVGGVYTELGRYADAGRLLTDALRRQRARLGPDHPDALTTQEALAARAFALNDYTRADALLRDALARRRRADPQGRATATTYAELGLLYVAMGRFADAERLLRRSMALHTASGDALAMANAGSTLGALLTWQRREPEADSLLDASLRTRRARLGLDHPDVADTLLDLVELRRQQGRLPEMEAAAHEALRIVERAYGPDHPATAHARSSYGSSLIVQGRLAEGEAQVARAAAAERATFGESRHQLAIRSSELSYAAYLRGDTTASIRLLRDALDVMRESPEWRNPFAGTISWNLATVLDQTGDLVGAAAAYRDALDVYTHALGADHDDTVLAQRKLGRALADGGSCTSAIPHLRASLPPLAAPGDGYDATARSGYGACLAEARAFPEAERQLRSAVHVLRTDPEWGPSDPRTREALGRLAALYEAWDRPAEAARTRLAWQAAGGR